MPLAGSYMSNRLPQLRVAVIGGNTDQVGAGVGITVDADGIGINKYPGSSPRGERGS